MMEEDSKVYRVLHELISCTAEWRFVNEVYLPNNYLMGDYRYMYEARIL